MKHQKDSNIILTEDDARKLLNWEEYKLTPLQENFVINYILNGKNGTDAVLTAGYDCKSRASAGVVATRLVKNERVKAAIKQLKDSYLSLYKGNLDLQIVDIWAKRATFNVKDFFNDLGEVKKISDIPEEFLCCIDNVVVKYYGKDCQKRVIELKIGDRDRALENLAKYIELQGAGDNINSYGVLVVNQVLSKEEWKTTHGELKKEC